MNLEEFVTIVLSSSALSGIIVGLLSYYQNRRKVLAEAVNIENQTLISTVKFQSVQIHELQDSNECLRKENQEIKKQLEALRAELELQKAIEEYKIELESQVTTLTERVETLELTLKITVRMFFEYIDKPGGKDGKEVKEATIRLLKDSGINI